MTLTDTDKATRYDILYRFSRLTEQSEIKANCQNIPCSWTLEFTYIADPARKWTSNYNQNLYVDGMIFPRPNPLVLNPDKSWICSSMLWVW